MNEDVWLVVGLGNPGPSYARTRHNVGYLVADLLAERVGGTWRRHRSGLAYDVTGRLDGPAGPRVVLGRARSYMNNSGGPVAALAGFYKIPAEHLVVVHDEIDLDYGQLRLKLGGGDNGHNGLKSVRKALGTGDFYRVRFGVGRPAGRQGGADYVLSEFSASERADLASYVDRCADAVESLLRDGLERAQNAFNQ